MLAIKNLVSVFFLGCSLFFFAAVLFVGCSGGAGNAGTANGGGSASFSSKLDGADFSSNKSTDNLNAAFRLKGEQKHIFFMLCDPDNPVRKLNFEVPGQPGTTTLTITPKYVYAGYTEPNWISYNDDGLTVTITINKLT